MTVNVSPESPRNTANAATAGRTELFNAERFCEWHGPNFRYVAAWQKWLSFDGSRYIPGDALASQAAVEVARRIYATAEGSEEMKWGVDSQSAAAIKNILGIARHMRSISAEFAEFNQNQMLLNVQNGTIDLRTGDLRFHDRRDLITKIAPVIYDKNADCPTWQKFIHTIMGGNQALIGFLQRSLGYSLTGDISEHVLFFFYGGGRNGKSTLTATIGALLGDYGCAAPRGLLFASNNEQHPTSLASLHGARFVVCPEVPKGHAFDEARVKDLTGGDRISARRMREDFWEFCPSHKLILCGNHKPVIKGGDDGIWRRMLLVPFLIQIAEKDVDLELPKKLLLELPGILNWCIEGCLAWQRDGLQVPAEVRDATKAYREESDALAEFFELCCVFESDARTARAMVRKAYEDYCEENGVRTKVDAKEFATRLRAAGCDDSSVRGPTGKTMNAWAGVRLISDEELTARIEARNRAEDRAEDRAAPHVQIQQEPHPGNDRDESDDEYDRAEREAMQST